MNTDSIKAALVSASEQLCVVDSAIDMQISKLQQNPSAPGGETELSRLTSEKERLEGEIGILQHWLEHPEAAEPY